MFDNEALNRLRGNQAQENRAGSLKYRLREGGFEVEKNDGKFLMAISKLAIKYGLFLAHQSRMKDYGKSMFVGLYEKNFPDEEKLTTKKMEELDLASMIDKDSGLPFFEIVHNQMVDDWANDPTTAYAIHLSEIDEIEDADPAIAFRHLQATVDQMHDSFKKASLMEALSQHMN